MPISYLQGVFDCFLIPRMKRVDYLPKLRRSPLEVNLVTKIQEKPNVSRSERASQDHAIVKVVNGEGCKTDLPLSSLPTQTFFGLSRSPQQRTSPKAGGLKRRPGRPDVDQSQHSSRSGNCALHLE